MKNTSRARSRLSAGWIWPAGRKLPMYALEQGWTNVSVQGSHSQILSSKGPHMG